MLNETKTEQFDAKMTQFEVINALYDSKVLSKFKLTAGAKLVLMALARHYNPKNSDFFPSYSCIAEHTGISKKSVERGIKELVAVNFISYRTQKVNRYQFTDYFFACVNLSVDQRQNVADDERQNVAQTYKTQKRIKKDSNLKKPEGQGSSASLSSEGIEGDGVAENEFQIDYCKYSQSKVYKNFRAGENFYRRQYGEGASCFGADVMQDGTNCSGGFGGSGSYYEARNSYLSAEKVAKNSAAAAKRPTQPTDGGSGRVPSPEATSAYLNELRESRKHACAPLDFEPERAERWYRSLTPLLKTSVMAHKVAAKFGFKD